MSPDNGFPGMPADPVHGVMGFAIQMHETFEAFKGSGFSDDQAMQFCVAMMGLAALNSQNPEA